MKWNDFLNPRSMLTPGVAGSVVMVIANTLWIEFLIPQKWTALILSFLLIIPILVRFSASLIENLIYFTFNGLIVFALSVNANFAGQKIQDISVTPRAKTMASQPLSDSLKPSLALINSPSNNETEVNKVNGPQLALNDNFNDDQGAAISTIQSTNETKNDDLTKEEEKKKMEKKQKIKKQNKNDREFFEPWF